MKGNSSDNVNKYILINDEFAIKIEPRSWVVCVWSDEHPFEHDPKWRPRRFYHTAFEAFLDVRENLVRIQDISNVEEVLKAIHRSDWLMAYAARQAAKLRPEEWLISFDGMDELHEVQ